MFDYDVVIIGGGPAALSAGLHLARAKRRTLLLERDLFGGRLPNIERIENYPGFQEGISGAQLSGAMVEQAMKYGLQLEMAEVSGIELFSSCRYVSCTDGKGYTAGVVIVATGARAKQLGVPGEVALRGKGVFDCALCDGGEFIDQVVAVCGAGNSALTDALYMTKLASKVCLLTKSSGLRATAVLQERALANPKLEIHYGVNVEAILGDGHVEGLKYRQLEDGIEKTLQASGVLVSTGFEPNSDAFDSVLACDDHGRIVVDEAMQTQTAYVFAAGDVRKGSPRTVATAVGDGATAAIHAGRLLAQLAAEA